MFKIQTCLPPGITHGFALYFLLVYFLFKSEEEVKNRFVLSFNIQRNFYMITGKGIYV